MSRSMKFLSVALLWIFATYGVLRIEDIPGEVPFEHALCGVWG